jgi:hypothetical protein
LNLVDVETFSTSPNSDPLETLSKGKHKASNIVVFQVDYIGLVGQGECNEPKKKKMKVRVGGESCVSCAPGCKVLLVKTHMWDG